LFAKIGLEPCLADCIALESKSEFLNGYIIVQITHLYIHESLIKNDCNPDFNAIKKNEYCISKKQAPMLPPLATQIMFKVIVFFVDINHEDNLKLNQYVLNPLAIKDEPQKMLL